MASKPPEKTEERGLIKMNEPVNSKGTLQALLSQATDTIELVCPKFMTPEKVMKMVLIAVSREPKLLTCTQASILQAAMNAAECGLDCSGKLGEGWLIPFWNNKLKMNEAQFIPGYQGYIKLMCQHESVVFVESRLVYEDDDFEINYGSQQPIRHNPELRPKGEQVVMGAYAIVHMVGGHQLCEWMNLSELHEIEKRALAKLKNKQYSPWVLYKSSMQRKSVINRVQKYAPKTPEIQAVANLDNELNDISRQISAAVAENLTLPPPDDSDDDKNTSLTKRLTQQGDQGNDRKVETEDPPDMSDEEKAVRDTYESMRNDPEYIGIPECKRELLKLEGDNFSFTERITMALDNIKDIKAKHDKGKGVDF
jgi:recombination protein RecT